MSRRLVSLAVSDELTGLIPHTHYSVQLSSDVKVQTHLVLYVLLGRVGQLLQGEVGGQISSVDSLAARARFLSRGAGDTFPTEGVTTGEADWISEDVLTDGTGELTEQGPVGSRGHVQQLCVSGTSQTQ